MSGKKKSGAAELLWKAAAVAAVGAAAYGAYKLWSWSRDDYATAIWIPCRGKGVRITKGPERGTYVVQTGYTWEPEEPLFDTDEEETEMEISLGELRILSPEEEEPLA